MGGSWACPFGILEPDFAWLTAGAGLWSRYLSLLACHGSHQGCFPWQEVQIFTMSALRWEVLAQIS